MGKLFGTDGIRGKANKSPMDGPTAFKVGAALTWILERKNRRPLIVVSKDTRISGDMLEGALASGITSMGGDVCLTGILPTPGVAFAARDMNADAGIMISASHNPFHDNGIKIFSGKGFKLSDEEEEEMEQCILNSSFSDSLPEPEEIGMLVAVENSGQRYIEFVKSGFPMLSLKGLRIVLDTANGATFRTAPEAFRQLGAQVKVINNEPDGLNINERCGSQHTEGLGREVVKDGAFMGLAFDGDGDRLIAVDEKGDEISGDQCMFICAMNLKTQGLLKNDVLVGTVMSNQGLRLACREKGIKFHASKVGDRYVMEDMKSLGAVLGGEQSGHMIFLDHHTTGDGIISALQLASAVISQGSPLSRLKNMIDVYPQKLINVEVKSRTDISKIPEIAAVISEVEKALGDHGRVLVRYSGTQDMCRVMVEGPDVEITGIYCSKIAEKIRSVLG